LTVIRTGTDNAVYANPADAMPVQMTPMATAGADSTHRPTSSPTGADVNVNVPSVWRTNRTQAAAKVDALSSGGMDNYEIPAFLRKQAD
jgi:cell division protein FtsZ